VPRESFNGKLRDERPSSHGQFPGGTFDSSQRVSAALYFKQPQSTGGFGSRQPDPEEWRSSLDSFTKVDGIVFPEPPLEEGLGPFPLRDTHEYLPRGLLRYPRA
jgi:hypothetical protein